MFVPRVGVEQREGEEDKFNLISSWGRPVDRRRFKRILSEVARKFLDFLWTNMYDIENSLNKFKEFLTFTRAFFAQIFEWNMNFY